MRSAVIIIGPGFEDSEHVYPFYRLQEAGFTVDVATSNDKAVTGKHGLPVSPTISLKDLDPASCDLAVIPGGYEGPDRVRQVKEVLSFVKAMNESKKALASICHGPWVFVSAGILKGRRATSYKGCKDDLVNAGAQYVDAPVVVDGNIVTAQHYRDNPVWMKETLKLFGRL
ncbi:MAG: type 1 glutamine amidotransferase domain-containing protein [Elusimicrobiota bacterium]